MELAEGKRIRNLFSSGCPRLMHAYDIKVTGAGAAGCIILHGKFMRGIRLIRQKCETFLHL